MLKHFSALPVTFGAPNQAARLVCGPWHAVCNGAPFSLRAARLPPPADLQPVILSRATMAWIPFGDHPLKLERYRED